MALSTDVNLPRNHHARYPSRCIRCGEDLSGRTIRLWTHTIGWWTVALSVFVSGFTTRPPACSSCAWRIRSQRAGGTLLSLAIAAAFMFFVWPHIDDFVVHSLRKWVAVGMILVCIGPYLLWETIYPPAIDITAYKNSVDYEFRDDDFAYEFAELNADAEWVKIS